MECLYSKLGVSVIIPQTAVGYGIWRKFHFLPTSPAAQQLSAVAFSLSYKYKIVCGSGASPHVLSYSGLLPVLVKQHCRYLITYGQLLRRASVLELLAVLQPCIHVVHRRAKCQLI